MKEYTFKELRTMRGFTQEQLAEKAKITKDYISLIERGKRRPSDKLKDRLAEILNFSPVQIFLAIQRTNSTTKVKEESK